jgi:hypothetical protein
LIRANADHEAEARFPGVTRISADPSSDPAARGKHNSFASPQLRSAGRSKAVACAVRAFLQ